MTTELDHEFERAVEAIAAAPGLALACHVGPDGDALGSLLALHHLCRAHAKPSVASWSEPFEVAPHYDFLPGLDLTTKPADFPAAPEVMVTFDCGSLARLGDLAVPAAAARHLIVVDHHASNDRYGSINVIDAGAAATAVLVHRLAQALGWSLNRDAALCLYTGLVTDTGRFQYSNTTPEVFELARELAEFDLPIAGASRQLFELHRFTYLQMAGACLARAQLDRELRFVATWVTNFDLDGFGVDVAETEGLIDLVRRTAEADVACVCKETPEGVRVSLRSVKDDIDVGAVAAQFGGGGHKYAAGFVAAYPVVDVLGGIKAALREQREARRRENR
ncbi:MAG TPA: bifunctional oligoribonuclease/PAP phosphatase NrnA [Acidimicrobiales bacterium]|jgi:phosphoesterase RecJ-like protein|nr:bifunctional oligoribonuclease/PAP phosphatase NrnA [Acidimicrobiales bacterium]